MPEWLLRYIASSACRCSRYTRKWLLENPGWIPGLVVTPVPLPAVLGKINLPLVVLVVQVLVDVLQQEKGQERAQECKARADEEGHLVALVWVLGVCVEDGGENLDKESLELDGSDRQTGDTQGVGVPVCQWRRRLSTMRR